MSNEAKVRSVDALESLRASLVVFLSKARNGVDQVTDELRRTRQWVTNDRHLHWLEQCRKRTRMLEQARAELLTARRSNLLENLAVYELAVKKNQLALKVAEEKLEQVKRWTRDFDRAAEPLSRRLESLRHYLQQDLPEGITHLGQLIRLLEMYSETGQPLNATLAANAKDAPRTDSAGEAGSSPTPTS